MRIESEVHLRKIIGHPLPSTETKKIRTYLSQRANL